MPATYDSIATTTLAVATKTITFSSIPSTYTDLIIISAYAHTASDYMFFRVGNGSVDSSSVYSQLNLRGNGTNAASSRQINQNAWLAANSDYSGTNEWTTNIWQIQNYANATSNKTVLTRDNAASAYTYIQAGVWRNTSAINILSIISGGLFAIGSTFTIYGIKAA